MQREVVVTGIGVLAPIGIGRGKYSEGLLQGRTGFSDTGIFETTPFKVGTAGEIKDFDPVQFLGKKGLRTLDRSTRLICAASGLALEDTGLDITEGNTHSVGVTVGATFGSLHSISQFDRERLTEGPRYVNPSLFPNTVLNSPASQVSIRFKIKGFNTTVSTGFCAGLDALSYASDFISLGRADVVLAGAVEELCEEIFKGFHDLGCLSGVNGSGPVCRPFDARRDGTIVSEGAAILVIEDSRHAMERGAEILAVVRGFGNCSDPASNMNFHGGGMGLANAIKEALKNASCAPEDIGFIAAGANSTRGLDRMEAKALKEVFGGHPVPVSAVKSMVGESFSAGGGLSLAAAVCAINEGFIPPTVNYGERDLECDLNIVAEARREKVDTVLVTASDPYGQNAAVVLGRPGGAS